MVAVNYDWDEIEDNVDEEYDDAGTTVADYAHEPYLYGDLISQNRTGQSRFYCFDGLGSTLALTNDSGNITDSYAYTGFGELTERSGNGTNPFHYLGEFGYYRDSVTLQYSVRRRRLSPRNARWLTQDPARQELNAYQYVRNCPTLLLDPSGLMCVVCGWKPHFEGSADEADALLTDPIHRRAIDEDLELLRRHWGVPQSELPFSWLLGRYGKYPRVTYLDKGGNETVLVILCYAIDAYYCGDTCLVSHLEEVTEHVWYPLSDDKGNWLGGGPPKKLAPFHDHVPGAPVDPTTPPLLTSALDDPEAYPCDKVVVLQDCAARAMRPAINQVSYVHINATMMISDGPIAQAGGNVAMFEFEFEVGMKIFRNYVKTDNRWIREIKSKTLGNPSDCCEQP